jgi:hypothetical protein
MNSEEARAYCHAYLDNQLDQKTKSEIDRLLGADAALSAFYAEQREFLAHVSQRARDVSPPPNLEDGIRARLKAAQAKRSNIVPIPSAKPLPRRRWMMYAAGLLLTLGAGAALYWTTQGECPYMIACVDEHRLVLDGKGSYETKSSDSVKLAQWVGGEVQTTLKELPSGKEFNLALEGAGRVEFKSLRQWGSPGGVFVSYQAPDKSRVTLLVQRWPEEEPEDFNQLTYQGQTYWATRHKGFGLATWKSPDDKLVITVVTGKSKEGALEIAQTMRKQLDAQIGSKKVAFLKAAMRLDK